MNLQAYKLTLYSTSPQEDFYVDVLMELPLGIRVNGNRGKWVLKLKIFFMESNKQVKIGLVF